MIHSIMFNARKLLRHCFLSVAGLVKRPSPCVHILNGHMADWHHDNDADGERFYKQLLRLHRYCDFVNFEDAVKMIVNHEKVSRPTVAFTFDDGWRDCYTQIAPQLDKFGVNAMFFLNPNFIDAGERGDKAYLDNFTENITRSPGKKPMSWNQVEELKGKGYLFGAHTLDHHCISDDNDAVLEHQIGDCRTVLEQKLKCPCNCFAFPYGRLEHANKKSIDIACRHYDYVFSQSDHKHYFSFDGKVINRRHFEPFWPVAHVFYFLSATRS